jgi:hypothetical protein
VNLNVMAVTAEAGQIKARKRALLGQIDVIWITERMSEGQLKLIACEGRKRGFRVCQPGMPRAVHLLQAGQNLCLATGKQYGNAGDH